MDQKLSKKPNNKKKMIVSVLVAAIALIGVIVILFSMFSASQESENSASSDALPISGVWSAAGFTGTPSDPLIILKEVDGEVSGTYHVQKDSKIVNGVLSGNKVSAFWVEDSSTRGCDTKIDNRSNWGKIELTFNKDRDQFTGKWGYCEGYASKKFIGNRVNE